MKDLWAALCLVAVLEGLLLCVAPGAWRQAMVQLLRLGERQLRMLGAGVLGFGLLALLLVRAAG